MVVSVLDALVAIQRLAAFLGEGEARGTRAMVLLCAAALFFSFRFPGASRLTTFWSTFLSSLRYRHEWGLRTRIYGGKPIWSSSLDCCLHLGKLAEGNGPSAPKNPAHYADENNKYYHFRYTKFTGTSECKRKEGGVDFIWEKG